MKEILGKNYYYLFEINQTQIQALRASKENSADRRQTSWTAVFTHMPQ